MGETIPRSNLWDKFIMVLVNLLLRLTTKRYQETLEGVIDYGMNAAARDTLENREPPEHWSVYVKRANDILTKEDE